MKNIKYIKKPIFKIQITIACLFVIIFLAYTLGAPALAAENTSGEPVDRSGIVTRISIPNEDGTFTVLEGEKAQAWYNKAVIFFSNY